MVQVKGFPDFHLFGAASVNVWTVWQNETIKQQNNLRCTFENPLSSLNKMSESQTESINICSQTASFWPLHLVLLKSQNIYCVTDKTMQLLKYVWHWWDKKMYEANMENECDYLVNYVKNSTLCCCNRQSCHLKKKTQYMLLWVLCLLHTSDTAGRWGIKNKTNKLERTELLLAVAAQEPLSRCTSTETWTAA